MTRLRDIAEKAGVSTATVSRVLKMIPISQWQKMTRDRIIEIAEELGYERKGKPEREITISLPKGSVGCFALQ